MESENRNAVARVGADIALAKDGRLLFGNYAAVLDFTSQLVQAQMAPKGKTAQQCAISIVLGMSLGLPPFSAMQNIAVINGMPAVWGDAAVGLVKASGLEEWSETTESGSGEDFAITYTSKRKGDKNPVSRTFGYRDAKAAGLWGKQGPWTQYPKRMMFNRARAWALRDLYSDILKGIGIAEEVMDVTPVTDARVSKPPYAEGGHADKEEHKPATAASLIAAAAKPVEMDAPKDEPKDKPQPKSKKAKAEPPAPPEAPIPEVPETPAQEGMLI